MTHAGNLQSRGPHDCRYPAARLQAETLPHQGQKLDVALSGMWWGLHEGLRLCGPQHHMLTWLIVS